MTGASVAVRGGFGFKSSSAADAIAVSAFSYTVPLPMRPAMVAMVVSVIGGAIVLNFFQWQVRRGPVGVRTQ
jgi:hypothetical protein